MTISEQIREMGVVPVVVINRVEDALPLAKALCEGGLPCAEVTFRTAAAKDAIAAMSKNYPNMLVGAGTILNCKQVDEALEAGAKFIVSPGFDEKVVRYCMEKQVPVYPGCVTPSEIMNAIACGLEVVKFFPAESFGGVKMIKALAAPFRNISFMPTGGINASNLENYLNTKAVIACGGSWMVKEDLVQAGRFEDIKVQVQEAVALVAAIRNGEA